MYLRMYLDYLEHCPAHPFSRRGIGRTTISQKIQIFVITDHQSGPHSQELFTKSKRAFILMIWNHLYQYQVHPFFSIGGKSLQNPDFEILRLNRKSHNYGNFYIKQDSGNSIEVSYEPWLSRDEFQSLFEKSPKSAKIKISKKCSRTQPLHPWPIKTLPECF